MSATAAMWPAGAAYVDGRFMPVAEAMIPVTDWGYRRSDVTYDVVSVWDGAFFKLDDHLRRFRASMDYFRLHPRESDDRHPRHPARPGAAHRAARGLRRDGLPARRRTAASAPASVQCAQLHAGLRGAVRLADAARRHRARRAPDRRVQPAHPGGLRQSSGEELSLGRHDARAVRGAGQGRRQSRAARFRRAT